ncbi:MAG: dUTP diphosphatase [Bdellovibrio sp.]
MAIGPQSQNPEHFSIPSEKVKNEKMGLNQIRVRVKTFAHYQGSLPSYASDWASGFDVRAQLPSSLVLYPGERVLIPTGLSFEIPRGFELQCRPRSGLASKQGVSVLNTPGTIDADYRGEVKVILINLGQDPVEVHPQDRIAQLVLCPVFQAQFEMVLELSETQRGDSGFGSTGVRSPS